MEHTFPASEKLKSRKQIDILFSEGRSFSAYPVRVVWSFEPKTQSKYVKAAFSVSKRSFKHATDRNRLKRQMREAYRLQKGSFIETVPGELSVMFLYTAKEKLSYELMHQSVGKLLDKIRKAVSE